MNTFIIHDTAAVCLHCLSHQFMLCYRSITVKIQKFIIHNTMAVVYTISHHFMFCIKFITSSCYCHVQSL